MITVDRADDLVTITLNRPDVLNAAPPHMFDEIRLAAQAAVAEGVRGLLITGAGRAFCSGADLAVNAASAETPSERTRNALNDHYNPCMEALAALPIPIVCAVNGPAVGIGCSLALAGDIVVAGSSAYFLQAFVNIGLVPDGGATWALTRAIGTARAMEMMMLGERLPADKAAQWGLIHKAVADEALVEEAGAIARKLASGPTVALGLMRKLVRDAMQSDYAAALAAEAAAQAKASSSPDAIEGIAAFLMKRPANFTGK